MLFALAYLGLRRILEIIIWSRRAELDKEIEIAVSSRAAPSDQSGLPAMSTGLLCSKTRWLPKTGTTTRAVSHIRGRHDDSDEANCDGNHDPAAVKRLAPRVEMVTQVKGPELAISGRLRCVHAGNAVAYVDHG